MGTRKRAETNDAAALREVQSRTRGTQTSSVRFRWGEAFRQATQEDSGELLIGMFSNCFDKDEWVW